jgi:hypothetical protein
VQILYFDIQDRDRVWHLSNVGVRESDHGVLGKTTLWKHVKRKTGLHEHGYLQKPPQLETLHTLLNIKYLHTAWIADAASLQGG